MDIYVDGSTVDPKNMANAQKRNKVSKVPGAGYAVVTPDKIFIKRFNKSISTHFMEFSALLLAIRMASPGDVIYTDQKTLVDCIAEHGDPTYIANQKRVNTTAYVLKAQMLRALQKVGGVSIEYISSNEVKKLPCGSVARLADQFAGYASGGKTKHVLTYKGNREVITL